MSDSDLPTERNSDCVGPRSEEAGMAEGCKGCPSQAICASGALRGPDPAMPEINSRMAQVKHKILVLSGKGGVGKSTFSSQLALHFQKKSFETGLLDVDICGPSIPTILGLEGEQIHKSGSGWDPVYAEDNLAVVSVGFLIDDPTEAVIWRGPKKNSLIKLFMKDVAWGALDFLVVDTPPGTSDEHLSIVTYLKESNPDGAILITTPPEVALLDVRKEINFCKKVGIPVLGVVENMSGFVCPKCKVTSEIFPANTGGARQMCIDMDVPFLGSIPLDPIVAQSCDQGKSFQETFPDSKATAAYQEIFSKILNLFPDVPMELN